MYLYNMNLSSSEKLLFKQELKSACLEILAQRIATAEHAMQQAQDSANSDEKSSAGDKHETGRAMGQIDSEMNARQLSEAQKELIIVQAISTENICEKVISGCVVVCKDFLFYISMGLGSHVMNGKKVMLLSPKAPIAGFLMNKKAGDKFSFNGKQVEIQEVF